MSMSPGMITLPAQSTVLAELDAGGWPLSSFEIRFPSTIRYIPSTSEADLPSNSRKFVKVVTGDEAGGLA
ncbi:hypothetical protein, partial [Burkholderia sp. SIMBA_062]|uniref:hypothetical protein n=1 Tax=Burkholderia sp. SIMBA_062 TaxID=3085803 RepID=UPI00397C4750